MSAGALTDAKVLGTLSFAQEMKETDESKLQSLRDGVDGYASDIAQDIERIEESREATATLGGAGIALMIAGAATALNPEVGQAIGSFVNDLAASTGLTEVIAQGIDQAIDYIDDAVGAVGALITGVATVKLSQENQTLQEAKALQAEVSERSKLLDQVLEGESIDLSSVEQKDTGENISPSWAVSDEKGKSDISR